MEPGVFNNARLSCQMVVVSHHVFVPTRLFSRDERQSTREFTAGEAPPRRTSGEAMRPVRGSD